MEANPFRCKEAGAVGFAPESRPIAAEVVTAGGLLQFPDVVVLLTILGAERDLVVPPGPGHVIFEDDSRQGFGLDVVTVESEVAGIHGRPTVDPERIRQPELLGPILEIRQRPGILVGAVNPTFSWLSTFEPNMRDQLVETLLMVASLRDVP